MVPVMIVLSVVVVGLVAVVVLLARRAPDTADSDVGRQLQQLAAAQQHLVGQVHAVSEAQVQSSKALSQSIAQSNAELTRQLNARLEHVDEKVGSTLSESAEKTAKSLGDLTARLSAIDDAQKNIVGLADQVVSLQHVLDNNPARGAFGEVQLRDIIEEMLPNFAYHHQKKLANGKIVDCLIDLPHPPGPIAVDAKFPLAAYQAMLDETDPFVRETHAKQLTSDTRKHIKDIADKYVGQSIDGDRVTAESALMFIPSEAVYAELHAHHPNVIADSHRHRVYLVSPTTMMATLTTMRAVLRDVEMRRQATVLQDEVGSMLVDVARLTTRVGNLDRHLDQARSDVDEIRISAGKIDKRGKRIESLDLDDPDELGAVDTQDALPLR